MTILILLTMANAFHILFTESKTNDVHVQVLHISCRCSTVPARKQQLQRLVAVSSTYSKNGDCFLYPFERAHKDLRTTGIDLLSQKVRRGAPRVPRVSEVRRREDQRPLTHEIPRITEDLSAVQGVVGDGLVVLAVLGVSEEHGAHDLVLHGAFELGDGTRDQG